MRRSQNRVHSPAMELTRSICGVDAGKVIVILQRTARAKVIRAGHYQAVHKHSHDMLSSVHHVSSGGHERQTSRKRVASPRFAITLRCGTVRAAARGTGGAFG